MPPIDFSLIFSHSPNPYVLLDTRFALVDMNDAYLRVTMRERAELVGRSMFEAFPSDGGADVLRASLERVLETGQVDHLPLIRYDIARPEGGFEERYWSATHTPLLDASGAVALILQHTVDVTELHRLRSRGPENAPGVVARIETDVFHRAEAVSHTNRLLDAERLRLRSLFDQAPGFMAVLTGPSHVFELANAAYLDIVGARDLIGLSVREALPELEDQAFFLLLDEVYRTGRPFIGRAQPITLHRGSAAERTLFHLDFIYQPIIDASGTVTGIFVQGHDVTERLRAEEALAASHSQMREILETISEAFYAIDPQDRFTYVNRKAEELWGRPRDGLIGQVIWDVFDRAPDSEIRRAHLRASVLGSAQRLEYFSEALGGWVESSIYPGPTGLSVFFRDITERHRNEERRQLMVNELNHRVKNSLAVVQGIASQTLRAARDLDQARSDLTARLVALARAHDLLTSESWEGADLAEVVRATLEGGLGVQGRQVVTSGPSLRLSPNAALSLALALHELATNAIKYGALSVEAGRVEISWAIDPPIDAATVERGLRLSWTERDGPPVTAPLRRGFGSRLLQRGLAAELHGTVDLAFEPDGVVCRIEALV
ncbi:PAS domain-containing protein [Methylobacterium segetis]|uniref:PAS domain-containing protein n=1 Tax=Methylobacterium segetis TaxID=2488750 RepID=UPI0014050F1E|nr:PAS domain-containing protein [Methylobacterium segetis]